MEKVTRLMFLSDNMASGKVYKDRYGDYEKYCKIYNYGSQSRTGEAEDQHQRYIDIDSWISQPFIPGECKMCMYYPS